MRVTCPREGSVLKSKAHCLPAVCLFNVISRVCPVLNLRRIESTNAKFYKQLASVCITSSGPPSSDCQASVLCIREI